MAIRDPARRRRIRALEAKKDALVERIARSKVDVKKVRAELKAMRPVRKRVLQ